MHSVLRIKIEVDALSIRQSSLDLPSHIIGEHLIPAGFDCTQHLPNYVYRLDLRKSELTRHIRVDGNGMHAHHLRTLSAQSGLFLRTMLHDVYASISFSTSFPVTPKIQRLSNQDGSAIDH
jgi:hypothetical protein